MNFHIGGSDSERYKPSKKSEDPLIILAATSVSFLFNRQCRRLPGLTIDIPTKKSEIKR